MDTSNKPNTIEKLRQSYKLNNSLRKNSKMFLKKQNHLENNYLSMKNEYEIEKNDVFVIEDQLDQKCVETGTNHLKKSKEVYHNKKRFDLKKKDKLEDVCETSSDSSNSSKCNKEIRNVVPISNLNKDKFVYFTKEYISVPTYSITSNLKTFESQIPSKRNSILEPIMEIQTQHHNPRQIQGVFKNHLSKSNENFCKNKSDESNEARLFAQSKKLISPLDYLKDRERQWKIEKPNTHNYKV